MFVACILMFCIATVLAVWGRLFHVWHRRSGFGAEGLAITALKHFGAYVKHFWSIFLAFETFLIDVLWVHNWFIDFRMADGIQTTSNYMLSALKWHERCLVQAVLSAPSRVDPVDRCQRRHGSNLEPAWLSILRAYNGEFNRQTFEVIMEQINKEIT